MFNFTVCRRKFHPGEKGTKRLMRIWGDDLICVRYKYDYKRLKRYTTIELKVDEAPWKPKKIDNFLQKLVYIKLMKYETNLHKKVKQHTGRWNKEQLLWEIPLWAALKLKIDHRIISEVTKKKVYNNTRQ